MLISIQILVNNDEIKRATYSAVIKLETTQLVVDQGYAQEDAAKAIGIGKWVTQLKLERNGQSS
jgi:transposase